MVYVVEYIRAPCLFHKCQSHLHVEQTVSRRSDRFVNWNVVLPVLVDRSAKALCSFPLRRRYPSTTSWSESLSTSEGSGYVSLNTHRTHRRISRLSAKRSSSKRRWTSVSSEFKREQCVTLRGICWFFLPLGYLVGSDLCPTGSGVMHKSHSNSSDWLWRWREKSGLTSYFVTRTQSGSEITLRIPHC